MLLSAVAGSGLKMLGHAVSKYFELKRQKELAMLNASNERIIALQSGEDHADNWTRATRRALAFILVGTWCFIVIWHVVFVPETVYEIPIAKENSFLGAFFFSTTNQTAIQVSAGSLLWGFMDFVGLICGFYFTKMGK